MTPFTTQFTTVPIPIVVRCERTVFDENNIEKDHAESTYTFSLHPHDEGWMTKFLVALGEKWDHVTVSPAPRSELDENFEIQRMTGKVQAHHNSELP